MDKTIADQSALYDRVVREARQSFGSTHSDESVVMAAHAAVDELLVKNHAAVTTFIPVLAMRRLRESMSQTFADALLVNSVDPGSTT